MKQLVLVFFLCVVPFLSWAEDCIFDAGSHTWNIITQDVDTVGGDCTENDIDDFTIPSGVTVTIPADTNPGDADIDISGNSSEINTPDITIASGGTLNVLRGARLELGGGNLTCQNGGTLNVQGNPLSRESTPDFDETTLNADTAVRIGKTIYCPGETSADPLTDCPGALASPGSQSEVALCWPDGRFDDIAGGGKGERFYTEWLAAIAVGDIVVFWDDSNGKLPSRPLWNQYDVTDIQWDARSDHCIVIDINQRKDTQSTVRPLSGPNSSQIEQVRAENLVPAGNREFLTATAETAKLTADDHYGARWLSCESDIRGWCTDDNNKPCNGDDGSITVFATAVGGTKTTVTSVGHDIVGSKLVTIAGTTSYNGTHVPTNILDDTFEIPVAFVANDATGTWTTGDDRCSGDCIWDANQHAKITSTTNDDSVGDTLTLLPGGFKRDIPEHTRCYIGYGMNQGDLISVYRPAAISSNTVAANDTARFDSDVIIESGCNYTTNFGLYDRVGRVKIGDIETSSYNWIRDPGTTGGNDWDGGAGTVQTGWQYTGCNVTNNGCHGPSFGGDISGMSYRDFSIQYPGDDFLVMHPAQGAAAEGGPDCEEAITGLDIGPGRFGFMEGGGTSSSVVDAFKCYVEVTIHDILMESTGNFVAHRVGVPTAWADAGGGVTTVTSAAHGITTSSGVVRINGTAAYDGTHSVSSITTNTFGISTAFVSDEGTIGTWGIGGESETFLQVSGPMKIKNSASIQGSGHLATGANSIGVCSEDLVSICDADGDCTGTCVGLEQGDITFENYYDMSRLLHNDASPWSGARSIRKMTWRDFDHTEFPTTHPSYPDAIGRPWMQDPAVDAIGSWVRDRILVVDPITDFANQLGCINAATTGSASTWTDTAIVSPDSRDNPSGGDVAVWSCAPGAGLAFAQTFNRFTLAYRPGESSGDDLGHDTLMRFVGNAAGNAFVSMDGFLLANIANEQEFSRGISSASGDLGEAASWTNLCMHDLEFADNVASTDYPTDVVMHQPILFEDELLGNFNIKQGSPGYNFCGAKNSGVTDMLVLRMLHYDPRDHGGSFAPRGGGGSNQSGPSAHP